MSATIDAGVPQRQATSTTEWSWRGVERVAKLVASAAPWIVIVGLAFAVLRQGAYYDDDRRTTSWIVILAAVAGIVASYRPRTIRPSWITAVPIVGASVLGLTTIITAQVNNDVSTAWPTIAVLASMVAVFTQVRRAIVVDRDGIVAALLGVGVLAAGSGLIGVAWHRGPWALVDGGLWRAASTITYANATAALLAPILLLAVAWATDVEIVAGGMVHRVRNMIIVVIEAGLLATLSRAGIAAGVVGGVVLTVALRPRRIIRALPGLVGGLAAFGGIVPSMEAQATERPLVAALAMLAGVAVAAIGSPLVARGGRRLVVAVVGVVLVAIALVAIVDHSGGQIVRDRFTLASTDRGHELSTTLQIARENQWTGVGPGRLREYLFWEDADGQIMSVEYAHNEYAQLFAEQGVLGLAAFAIGIGAVAIAWWRLRRQQVAWIGLTVLSALTVLALHSGTDFIWHVPAIPLLGAALLALAMPASPRSNAQPISTTRSRSNTQPISTTPSRSNKEN